MSSAFERLQKLAEEKRLKEKVNKPLLEITPSEVKKGAMEPSAGGRNFPTAPEKDFAKVANSIIRQIPNGVFIGKSKQMYDYLYSLTRGAINPARSVRISKSGLMRGAGIKSTHTFYNNVRYLEIIRLIVITRIDGEKGGNSYEVILPEEIDEGLENLAQLAQLAQLAHPVQKLPLAPSAVSALGALGLNCVNKDTYSFAKTSFKDNIKTDDDNGTGACFSGFIEKFQTAAKKLTGAPLSKYEGEKWERLADLLILELEAASRQASNPISSVPGFLTKVLSSKLLNRKSAERISKSEAVNKPPDTVGKHYAELDGDDNEIKPMNNESKEAAVDFLREFKDDAEFLAGYKKWYTEADWNWVIEKLKIKN